MKKYNILIIDDHSLLAESLSLRLIELEFVDKVDVKNDILESDLSEFTKYDIILLDILLSDNKNSIEYFIKLRNLNKNIILIALTSNLDMHTMKFVYDNGADGYLNKSSNFDDFVTNLNHIITKGKYFPKELLEYIAPHNDFKSLLRENQVYLTNRELEILKLMSQNYSNTEIADLLNLSTRTIETHRKNLFSKFKVSTLNSLIKEAKSKQLI